MIATDVGILNLIDSTVRNGTEVRNRVYGRVIMIMGGMSLGWPIQHFVRFPAVARDCEMLIKELSFHVWVIVTVTINIYI